MTVAAVPQRTRALARAQEVRSERSCFRREMRAMPKAEGLALLIEALTAPSEPAAGMRVDKLLRCVRWIGDRRAHVVLRAARLPDYRRDARVRNLSAQERGAVAGELRRLLGAAR